MAGIYDYLYGPGGILQPGNTMGMPWQQPQMQGPPTPAVIGSPSGVKSDYAASYPTLGASLAGAAYGDPATTAGSVGGNVANVPLPMSRPTEAPGPNYASLGPGGQQGAGGGTPTGGAAGIRDALRGVTAPKPPAVQDVRTPAAPQTQPIKGGEFLNLLASLGVGPQELMRLRLGGR